MKYQANSSLSQDLVDEFWNHYADKKSAVKEHVEKVKDVLEEAMKSGVFRAIPITTRMKELDSALGSLQRRQAARFERQELKKLVEDHGKEWELHCKESGQEQMITAWKPFAGHQSMLDALHEFGVVRVCVYFPDDVVRVVSFLEQHEGIKIVQNARKTQASSDVTDLRKHAEVLEKRPSHQAQGQLKRTEEEAIGQENLFAGYRATHVVVELLGDAIPEGTRTVTTRLRSRSALL